MIKSLEKEKQMLSSQLRDLEWRLDQESKVEKDFKTFCVHYTTVTIISHHFNKFIHKLKLYVHMFIESTHFTRLINNSKLFAINIFFSHF